MAVFTNPDFPSCVLVLLCNLVALQLQPCCLLQPCCFAALLLCSFVALQPCCFAVAAFPIRRSLFHSPKPFSFAAAVFALLCSRVALQPCALQSCCFAVLILDGTRTGPLPFSFAYLMLCSRVALQSCCCAVLMALEPGRCLVPLHSHAILHSRVVAVQS